MFKLYVFSILSYIFRLVLNCLLKLVGLNNKEANVNVVNVLRVKFLEVKPQINWTPLRNVKTCQFPEKTDIF